MADRFLVRKGGLTYGNHKNYALHVGKGSAESRAISNIIDYVANPKETDNGRLITGYMCDSRRAGFGLFH